MRRVTWGRGVGDDGVGTKDDEVEVAAVERRQQAGGVAVSGRVEDERAPVGRRVGAEPLDAGVDALGRVRAVDVERQAVPVQRLRTTRPRRQRQTARVRRSDVERPTSSSFAPLSLYTHNIPRRGPHHTGNGNQPATG